MPDEQYSTSISSIPKLIGNRNFIAWRRAILAYLSERGARRVLEGFEKEPYRLEGESHRPPGEYAGANPPSGFDASGEKELNEKQLIKWDEWQSRESKARAAIILSVSQAIAGEIDGLWSAHDMYKLICSLFSVGNDAQKGDISRRLDTLTLRENATSQEMQAHFDAFFALLSEGKSIGLDVADWDRREKFLLSLPRDLQTILRTSLRGRSTQTWAELCSLFNEEIDIRSRQDLRDAQINAAVKMEKGGRRQQDNGEKGGKGGKKHKKKKGGEVKKCGWCGIKGHEEKECRKKAAGDPSQAEIRQAIQHIRQQKSSQGQSGSARFIDATAWSSAPTLFDNSSKMMSTFGLPSP